MNHFQKRYHREQGKQAAAGYVAAADCIGKEFVFSAYIYRVVQYHPRNGKFTCERVNAFNQRVELDETFVRHHCTPIEATLPQPGPRDYSTGVQPRYFLFPPVIIEDKTQVGDEMTLTAQTNMTPDTVNAAAEVAAPLDPAHYLDQKFEWESDGGTHFNLLVQSYHAERKAFLLHSIGGTIASFYRDEAFVYEHCVPAAQPVVREPLPKIEFDPRRYWNLVSLSAKRQYIAADVQAAGEPAADPLLQCECCGQHVTVIGKQIWSSKMNRKDSIIVECRNEDCITYRRTATTDSHSQICADAKKEQAS